MGPSWAVLGASWALLGAILGRLGAVLGRLGAILGNLEALLGPQEAPGAQIVRFSQVLASFWAPEGGPPCWYGGVARLQRGG